MSSPLCSYLHNVKESNEINTQLLAVHSKKPWLFIFLFPLQLSLLKRWYLLCCQFIFTPLFFPAFFFYIFIVVSKRWITFWLRFPTYIHRHAAVWFLEKCLIHWEKYLSISNAVYNTHYHFCLHLCLTLSCVGNLYVEVSMISLFLQSNIWTLLAIYIMNITALSTPETV